MKAKDAIKLACTYLGDYDMLDITELGGQSTSTDLQKAKLKQLMTSINDVVQSLALMYFPLKKQENISSQTKQYSYSLCSETVLEIVKVWDLNNNLLKFKCYPEYFTTDETSIKVEYCYQPDFVTNTTDDLDIYSERVTDRLIAIGILARYYLYQGMYQESSAWENMFERAVLVSKSKDGAPTLKKRSWY